MPKPVCTLAFGILAASLIARLPGQIIPVTWDETALATGQLKPPSVAATVKPVPASYYYRMRERVMYRRYPVYSSKTEPPGYLDKLANRNPKSLSM